MSDMIDEAEVKAIKTKQFTYDLLTVTLATVMTQRSNVKAKVKDDEFVGYCLSLVEKFSKCQIDLKDLVFREDEGVSFDIASKFGPINFKLFIQKELDELLDTNYWALDRNVEQDYVRVGLVSNMKCHLTIN